MSMWKWQEVQKLLWKRSVEMIIILDEALNRIQAVKTDLKEIRDSL